MNEESVEQGKKSSKRSPKEDNIDKPKREDKRSSPINTPTNSNSPSITRHDSKKSKESSSDSESDEEKHKKKTKKKRPSTRERGHSRGLDEIQEVPINTGSSPSLSSSPSSDSLKKQRKEKKEKKSHSTSPSGESPTNSDAIKSSKEEDANLKASTDSPAQIPLQNNEKSEKERKERRENRKLREKSRSDLSKESNAEEKPSEHKSPSEHRSKSDYPRKSSRADRQHKSHSSEALDVKPSKMEITSQSSEESVGLHLRPSSSAMETNPSRNSVTELRSVKSADNAKEEQGRRNKEALRRLSAEDMYHSLPNAKLLRVDNPKELLSIQGPDDKDCWSSEGVENFYCDNIAVKTASTYPHLPGRPFREGDPICDSFSLRVYEKRTVIALADGCNWGYRPQEAARRACKAFMEYILANMDHMKDIKDCGHYLLRACDKASREIIRDKDDIWEAGTTTLIGGLLLELEDQKWAYVCVSIGDCKALRWSNESKELVDITQGNRRNLTDARDPGGRLGPYLENGVPDLRNLKLYFVECEPDDLILIVSDGVHDNYDPQQLGKTPSEFGVNATTWEEAELKFPIESETAKNEYRVKALTKYLLDIEAKGGLYPKNIAQSLIQYCQTTTESSRVWMQENPTKRLPFDCVAFPGKMDHSTAVVIRVGPIPEKPTSDPSSKTN